MNSFDTEAVAQMIIEDRVRDAAQRRMARSYGRPSAAPTQGRGLPHHFRLWSLVHLSHTHS